MKKAINITTKGFVNLRKGYPTAKDALNEILTNSFFAPEAKTIMIYFLMEKIVPSFYFCNDGVSLSQEEMENILSTLGCESSNTGGNENGTGLKSAAAYFTSRCEETSILFMASKENGVLKSFGFLDAKGEYGEYEDLFREQKEFVDVVISSTHNGTFTGVYNCPLTESEVNEFKYNIRFLLKNGLNNINVFVKMDDEEPYKIRYFDPLYRHLDYPTKFEKRITFEFNKKLFDCILYGVDTNTIKAEDYDFLDEINGDCIKYYGLSCGYEDGYTPIPYNVSILTYGTQPQYNHCRFDLIALINPKSDKSATYADWKELYTTIGRMTPQKVPNLTSPFKYKSGDNIYAKWSSFYDSVIAECSAFYGETKPINERNMEDKYSEEKVNELNQRMNKYSFIHCDNQYNFQYSSKLSEDTIAKFDTKTNTIIFAYNENSKLIKKLRKGGRDGRNGDNDLDRIIEPIIDIIKMDVMSESTTDKIKKALTARAKKMNNYYAD